MKPHPRIRKTIKWAGLVLTILLIALWLVSGMWTVTLHRSPTECAWFYEGTLIFVASDDPSIRISGAPGVFPENPFSKPPGPFGMRWTGTWYHPPSVRQLILPLWPFIVVSGGATAFAWRLDRQARRRARTGSCLKCGYSRTGLASDRPCPECGAAAPPPTPAAT